MGGDGVNDISAGADAPYLTPLPLEGIVSVTIPMTSTLTPHPVPLLHKHLFRGLHHPNPSCPSPPRPRHLSLITTYCPGLHRLKQILREGLHILSSDPSIQHLLTKPPSVTFRKPSNFRQLIVDTRLHPHRLPTLQ